MIFEGLAGLTRKVAVCSQVDTYFGRWLVEGTHYKRLKPESMCEDLDTVIDWVKADDGAARRQAET